MLLEHFENLILIVFIFHNLSKVEATKCGEHICEGKAECKWNTRKDKLECVCDQGTQAKITGNFFKCYPNEITNEESKCLKIGASCGVGYICNHELKCQQIDNGNEQGIDKNFKNCAANGTKCLERCCKANEICIDGKCIIRPPTDFKNCATNETQCLERCCKANEICINGKCIIRPPTANNKCPESLKCLDKCCLENEFCSKDKLCVEKVKAIVKNSHCAESKKCQDKCCQENEICENGKTCVLKQTAIEKCPKMQKCLDKCCNSNEICQNQTECVARGNQCPLEQICLDKCCSPTQICTKEFKCVEEIKVFDSTTTDIPNMPTMLTTIISVITKCPLTQQCLDLCCREQEKCSKSNECIPVELIECYETEFCGDKCCPINKTCTEDLDCVPFIEMTTMNNCSEKQQCLSNCCAGHEMCNELNECVARITKKELLSFEELPVTEPSIDEVFQLYNFDNRQPSLQCPENYFICQQKCCNSHQTCSLMGDCVEEMEETVTLKDCESQQNCAENENLTKPRDSLAYTLIGLGCFVLVVSFASYKVVKMN